MNDITMLLFKQIILMFLLMLTGFVFYKKQIIKDQTSKDLGQILLKLVIPVVIINNFCIERTPEKTQDLIISAALSLVALVLAMAVSYIVFRRKDTVANFSSSFSNCGFIGIPLVSATLGSQAVFYISTMVALINTLQPTYGAWVMSGDKSVISFRKVATHPVVLAVIAGIIIYFTQIPVPTVARSFMTTISGLNTPLAMLISGVYLAQSDLIAMFKKPNTYVVSLFRLVIIPVLTFVAFKLIPFGSTELKVALLITAACPVGSNVAIFAQMYDQDYKSAVEQVCLTTIFCLITIPLLISICTGLF